MENIRFGIQEHGYWQPNYAILKIPRHFGETFKLVDFVILLNSLYKLKWLTEKVINPNEVKEDSC